MIRQYFTDSAGHFWKLTEFKNAANLDFKNLKHLKNTGYLFLTEGFMSLKMTTMEDDMN